MDQVVELVGGGSVINRAYPVYFLDFNASQKFTLGLFGFKGDLNLEASLRGYDYSKRLQMV